MPFIREVGTNDLIALGRALNEEFYEGQRRVRERFKNNDPRLTRWKELVMSHLEDIRRSSDTRRGNRKFDQRMRRNRARAQILAKPSFDSEGLAIEGLEDSNRWMNQLTGISARNIRAGRINLQRMILGRDDFFAVIPWGRTSRSRRLKIILRDFIVGQLRRGKFYTDFGPRLMHDIAHMGTGYLDYDMKPSTRFVRDDNNNLTEVIADVRPYFNVPRIEDVYVTDWRCPNSWDQEGVFVITPATQLHLLEPHEATFQWVVVGEPGNQQLRLMRSGEYTNLDELRERVDDHWGYSDTEGDEDLVSSFPTFAEARWMGSLPMRHWVRRGDFDMDMAEYFFPDYNLTTDIEGTRLTQDEFLRRIGLVTHWRVNYTLDMQETTRPSGQGNVLLSVRPEDNEDFEIGEYRNTLTNFHWLMRDGEFLGDSIVDLGYKLEDYADSLINAQAHSDWMNSHRPMIINMALAALAAPDSDPEELAKPNGRFKITNPDVKIDDIVKTLEFPEDFNLQAKLNGMAIPLFDEVTGITPVARASAKEETLGQTQINQAAFQGQIGFIAEDAANRLCARVCKNIVLDTIRITGWEGFRQLAVQFSRMNATHIDDLREEIEGGRFSIVPRIKTREEDPVRAVNLQRNVSTTPELWDQVEVARRMAEATGEKDIDDLIRVDAEPIPPEDAYLQIADGEEVPVMPNDDHMAHILFYQQKIQEIDARIQSGEFDQDEFALASWQAVVEKLTLKIQIHDFARQQQQVGHAEGAQGGARSGETGSASPDLRQAPGTGEEQTSNIQSRGNGSIG